MERPSDSELLTRTRAGDPGGFRLLIERHKDPMVKYLTRMTGSRERAEELAQESFVRLYFSPPRLDADSTVAPWLYRVATNLLRSEERRARRARMLAWLLGNAARGGPVAAATTREEARTGAATGAWRATAASGGLVAATAGVGLATAPDQETRLLSEEAQRYTQAALAALPVTFRAPLVLRELEGLSYEEIARSLRCPVGTVRSRINRGRTLLRERLAPYHHDGDPA